MAFRQFFSIGIWQRFGATLKSIFWKSTYLRYDFGIGAEDVRDAAKYWLNAATRAKLQQVVTDNHLGIPGDDTGTVLQVMQWVNRTYPASQFYRSDNNRETWNDPATTLHSLETRKADPSAGFGNWNPTSKTWVGGVATTDCDDYAILIYSLCRVAGVPSTNLYLAFLNVPGGWHLNGMFFKDNVPYALEGTYHPEIAEANFGKVPYDQDTTTVGNGAQLYYYNYVQWIFNETEVLKYTDKINSYQQEVDSMAVTATGSPTLALNKEDMKSVGKGLLIATAGVIATFLEENIPSIDFGKYTSVAAIVNMCLVNLIRLWVSNNQK